MNIKRILTLALCVVYMFSAAVFAAAETAPEAQTLTVSLVDGVAGTVKVSGVAPSGAADKIVTLLVVNVDVNNEENNDMEDIEANIAERVQYQDTLVTGENGYFEKVFTLYMDNAILDSEDNSTAFAFYAGGEAYAGYEVATGSYWKAADDAKIAAAKAILETADVAAAGALIEENKAVFAIDGDLYASLDKAELAELLKASVEANLFEGYVAGNEEAYMEAYGTFEKALLLSVAIEGFNQNKKEYSLNGTAIVNDEILGLTDYAKANGTLYTIYSSELKATGVTNALNNLFGKGVQTVEELKKLFAQQIVVEGIKNNKKNGYGIIDTVVTEENLAAAGYDVVTAGVDTLKTTYFDVASKTNINEDIYLNRNSITAENLEAQIIASAKKDYSPDDPTGNGGAAGPSSGSNSGSISVGGGGNAGGGAPAYTEAFTDLKGYDWAKTAIIALANKGIINGVADKTFNPAGTLTREQAAKIICLAAGIDPVNSELAFADVDANAWYAPYIAALSKAGIINGVSDTAFGIGNNVTREDFAVMICRALNFSATRDNSFTDKAEISSYAKDAVNALYEQGIVGGYEDGSFKPKANISRAEGAKIIYGILSK